MLAPASLGQTPFSGTRAHLLLVHLARSGRELTLSKNVPLAKTDRAAPQVSWICGIWSTLSPKVYSGVELPLPTIITCLITHPLLAIPSSAHFLTSRQCFLTSPPNICT